MKKRATRGSYARAVEAFRRQHDLWTTEDVLAACQMELELIGTDRDLSGTRTVWVRLAADARKQLYVESGGGRDLSDAIIQLASTMPRPNKPRPE